MSIYTMDRIYLALIGKKPERNSVTGLERNAKSDERRTADAVVKWECGTNTKLLHKVVSEYDPRTGSVRIFYE